MASKLILIALIVVTAAASRVEVSFDYGWRWQLYDAPADRAAVAASCAFTAQTLNKSANCDLSGLSALHYTPQGRENADDCRMACCALDDCKAAVV